MIRPEIAHLAVPIDSVTPYPNNPRNGDTEAITASLRAHGQYRPVVVRRSTGEVLAGNHTYAAMMEMGATQIAATFVDVDDDQAARIVLADNRTSDLARYDLGVLDDLLASLPDPFDGSTGWTESGLSRILAPLLDEPTVPSGDGPSAPTARPETTYVIGFDTEDQHAEWLTFLRRLRALYPEADTVGGRLVRHITDWFDSL